MFCLQQLSCICSLIACIIGDDDLQDLAQCLNCVSDSVFCTVCACMQTQHKIELDKRDGIKSTYSAMQIPPPQEMSRADYHPPQASPTATEYPQPPPFAHPPHG
ncbi:unnamed protein product [Amaranthus hypochondriacus]